MSFEDWKSKAALRAKREQERRKLEEHFNAEIVRRHKAGVSGGKRGEVGVGQGGPGSEEGHRRRGGGRRGPVNGNGGQGGSERGGAGGQVCLPARRRTGLETELKFDLLPKWIGHPVALDDIEQRQTASQPVAQGASPSS